MKNKIIIVSLITISTLCFYSCGSVPLAHGPSYNNPTYNVSYLFEHEGVKIYKFFDNGNSVYFTQPVSNIYSIKNDSTQLRIQTIGADNNQVYNEVFDETKVFNLEGVSSEGAEAKAYYLNSKIMQADVNMYGETGKTEISYYFNQYDIDVVETVYSYKRLITDVESEDDIYKEYELKYTIDYNGKRLGSSRFVDCTDIFNEFKRVVPFEI